MESERPPLVVPTGLTAGDRLRTSTKAVFGVGDLTINLAFSAMSFYYLVFLTEHAGMRASLAGLVLWVARAVDAFTDPTMGRISDLTRLRAGRRRPYFLLAALPFGASFAFMWTIAPFETQLAKFAYYALVYAALSVFMTALSVPYYALIPEMAVDYDERTSLNTFRSAASVLGAFAAVGMKALVDAFGGEDAAWLAAGGITAIFMVLPWIGVFRVSFERPAFARETQLSFVEGARIVVRHASFRLLCGFYITTRMAMDLLAAMLLIWFKYWIGREGDFQITMLLFLTIVVVSLPFWLRFARRHDKRSIFLVGTTWWIVAQLSFLFATPEWSRATIFAIAAFAAVGYAVADLMPWSMLGDVVDEDELRTGERREGVYVGFYMFLRKLAAATALLLFGVVLELGGYEPGVPREAQPPEALVWIRTISALGPVTLLALAIPFALRYPLSRAAHQKILDQLELRNHASRSRLPGAPAGSPAPGSTSAR